MAAGPATVRVFAGPWLRVFSPLSVEGEKFLCADWTAPRSIGFVAGADDDQGIALDIPAGKDYAVPAGVIQIDNHGAVMLVGRPCSK